MINVFYDSYRVLFLVYSDGAFLKQAMSDVFIEEKNRAHTTKICYGVLDRDIEFEYVFSKLCDKRPKQAVRIILKIAMYSIKYLKTAPYAVVDAAVELIKKLGKGGTSGFVNAFLRKYASYKMAEPADETQRLSVKYSYPIFAVKRLCSDYGMETAEKIMGADSEMTTVRFNSSVNGEEYLEDKRWIYEKTPFFNTFFVKGFKRDSDFDKGIYTFQSIGSVAICDMVGNGNALLDACAAPGGKSVNLADKFNTVNSFELHEHRVELIKDYARRMNKTNITAVCKDSSIYDEEYSEKFDTVLCDVPCSGYGVVKDNPDIKLRRTEGDVEKISETQLKILETCSRYVKNGGYLYYSTCSVFKSENESVCLEFLRKHADFAECETEPKLNHLKMKAGVSFLPDLSFGAGFYFCKFKKSEK